MFALVRIPEKVNVIITVCSSFDMSVTAVVVETAEIHDTGVGSVEQL